MSLANLLSVEQIIPEMKATERWAAIVPICGGVRGNVDDAAKKIKDIPCWCFHGDADRMIPVGLSRAMINAIEAAGGRPLCHEYPGVPENFFTLKAFCSAAQRLCFVSRAFWVFQEEFFRLVAIQGFNGNGTSAAGEG
jgi:hypothetical protein